MTHAPDLIATAFNALIRAMAEIGADFAGPERDRRGFKGRCLTEMKRLTLLIRRLIALMAIAIELKPAAPRQGHNQFQPRKADAPPPQTDAPRGISVTPAAQSAAGAPIRAGNGLRRPSPTSAIALIRRWKRLVYTLQNRDAYALRLARAFRAWRHKGEPAPLVLPFTDQFRLPPHLGLIAGAMTLKLRQHFANWQPG